MSVKKFRFVSPGVFVNEIDNSQIPGAARGVGPVVIGRTERGPAMTPVEVGSFSEFVELFGNPIPGGAGGDVWRDGNYTAPTYAAYAAQAWLRNSAPCTIVRLLGTHHKDKTVEGKAGWETSKEPSAVDNDISQNGGAYGLFIAKDVGSSATPNNAALAAVIYVDQGTIGLVGDCPDGSTITATESVGTWVKSQGASAEFKLKYSTSTSSGEHFSINFDKNSKKFIRKVLNTNPTLANDTITDSKKVKNYWLGETYERHLDSTVADYGSVTAGGLVGIILALDGDAASATFAKHQMRLEAQAAATPWVFSQHVGDHEDFKVEASQGAELSGVTELFRFVALSEGEWSSKNLKIAITDIKASDDEYNPYGTFTVAIRSADDSDNAPRYIERFTNCSLNMNSNNYIAKKIGDMKEEWSYDESRYTVEGDYPNASRYIRVEVSPGLSGVNKDLLPFGFYGIATPRPVFATTSYASGVPAPMVQLQGLAESTNTNSTAISVSTTAFNGHDDPGPRGYTEAQQTTAGYNLIFPAMPCRSSSSDSPKLSSGTQAFFGITTNQKSNVAKDRSYPDFCKPYSETFSDGTSYEIGNKPAAFPQLQSGGTFKGDSFIVLDTALTKTKSDTRKAAGDFFDTGIAAYFSLDDLVMDDVVLGDGTNAKSNQDVTWAPGSRFAGASISVRGADAEFYDQVLSGTSATGSIRLDGPPAFAWFGGHNTLSNATGDFTIENTDGTSVTFTISSAANSASNINDNAANDADATESLYTAFAAAIQAGTLKAVITDYTPNTGTSFKLTQLVGGAAGNNVFSGTATSTAILIGPTSGTMVDFVTGTSAFASGADLFVDGDEFTLTDAEGNSATFHIDTAVTTATGAFGTGGESAKVIIGTSTLDTKEKCLDQVTKVINLVTSEPTNGLTLNITASTLSASNEVSLTQDTPGVEGNDGNTGDIVQNAGASITIVDFAGGGNQNSLKPGTYKDVLDHGYDQFALPLFGGFDGLDIREREPFRNTKLLDGDPKTNYAYNSVHRAIDSIADPEVVEMNLAVMPGITNSTLTSHLLSTCESRADSLAIIDLEHDYVPDTEDEKYKLPDVKKAVAALKGRGINSSYGCTYFPWVQIRDSASHTTLWSPPSVVALGTMASSERKSELWFAPAGFNRGGLTEGSAGIPVVQVRRKLTSKDRDKLYEANINPIASFPAEGIVIFGQKTLQVTPSALDRINVRRLLIYLKKVISRISSRLLFDQNVPATWQRFTSQVEPFLASVKNRFGLSDFKVFLDESTTTPDLIDRNVMYAKIMLKPARAIEFIAIDFVITRTGASFDD